MTQRSPQSAALNRRHFVRAAAATSALVAGTGCSTIANGLARDITWRENPPLRPPVGTRAFVNRMFGDLDRKKIWDVHAHVLTDGKTGSGGYVNEKFDKELIPSIEKTIYLASGGFEPASDPEDDMELRFIDRTLTFHRLMNPDGKIVLFAFDAVHDDAGNPVKQNSTFYVPNDWVLGVAEKNHDVLAACSVHPHRQDALDLLEEAAARGAVACKWLPNSQVIDTSDKKHDAFYKKISDLGLVLIVHAGEEQAAQSIDKDAGNPLRLRRALDNGCRVVIAHCAGLGEAKDTDNGGKLVPSYDLFRRLLDEEQYEGRLWGDVSAMFQFNRTGDALDRTLMDTHMHHRLVNGSDYPLPAIDFLVSSRWLERFGYLSTDDRKQCNRVFDVNPLLYDFCIKRAARVERDGVEYKLSDIVFETSRIFDHQKAGVTPAPPKVSHG